MFLARAPPAATHYVLPPHLGSRRVAPPEILGQIDDVAALASAEDLQHCVELGAQLGDLLIALCQQCSDAVGDAVDEFLFGKWGGVGLRGRRASVFPLAWGQQPVGWPARGARDP